MSFQIAGLGTASPEHFVEQRDAAEIVARLCCETSEQQLFASVVYAKSGVKTRCSVVLDASSNGQPAQQSFFGHYREQPRGPSTAERMRRYEAAATPLALAAARAALEDAGVAAAEVTHLVSVSCSGFAAPGFDLALIRDLPLHPATSRTQVGFMGCHGAINAMRVAKAYADADPKACVLLCAVELCSLHHQYTSRADQMVANALFADGAAALVGRHTYDAASPWQVVGTGSAIVPESEEMMAWHIRDHGFEMTLSPQVPALIYRTLRPWLEQWLAGHGLSLAAVGAWAIHPGGPKILQSAAESIGIDLASLSHSFATLADYGNMSSPTILFILDRMRKAGAARPCVALAFGPGLAIEAALIR